MQIIEATTDTLPEQKPVETPPTETVNISDLLKDYKEVPPTNTAPPATGAPVNTPIPNGNPTSYPPGTEFYKTGKKAGQPKPPKKVAFTYNPATQPATLSGEILTGALFLTLVDLIIPTIIVGINNRFTKQKIKATDLQLSAAQKKELAPIADQVIKQIDIKANPTLLLCVSMLGIYGANFAMLKLSEPKQQNNEKTNNQNSQNGGGQNSNGNYYP